MKRLASTDQWRITIRRSPGRCSVDLRTPHGNAGNLSPALASAILAHFGATRVFVSYLATGRESQPACYCAAGASDLISDETRAAVAEREPPEWP